MNKQQALETIELLERLRAVQQLWLDSPDGDPILEMSLILMKRHLTGQLTTPTNLAQSAHVPYTTATRRVAEMQKQGLLEFRPRTKTGKTFSVHPSPKLISNLTSLLASSRAAIAASSAGRSGSRRRKLDALRDDTIGAPSIAPAGRGFGKGLDILVLDDPAYSIGKPLQRELRYLMGGQVRFYESSIDGLRREILTNAGRAESRYDIVAVDLPMIAELVGLGALLPLDEIAAQSDLNSVDFVAAAWQGAMVDEVQYAIPVLINPQLLFYRRDLLHEAQLGAPQTTEQVLQIARALHDPGRGQYGLSWTGARGAPVGQAFIQFLADFGQPVVAMKQGVGGFKTRFDEAEGFRPQIDTARGRATAQFMLDLLEVSAPDTLSLGWDGQVPLLRDGAVAMAYEWASRATQLSGSPAAGDLGYLPHPTGVFAGDTRQRAGMAPIGGFAFGIPANLATGRRHRAWSAIEWLSSPQVIKLLAQHGGYVTPRASVAADPDVQRLSPMIAAVDRMAKRGQISLWPRPPVASYAAMVEILGEEIHDMLRGKRSVGDALQRAQTRAEAL